MPLKVVMTGATGLIGTHIFRILKARGDKVTIFSRSLTEVTSKLPAAEGYVRWDPTKKGDWEKHLNDKDAIIHLAGAPVMAKRWSDDYKDKIFRSRETSTRIITEAIGNVEIKPKVFISASAIGYYGSEDNGVKTEDSPQGNDFLSDVCNVWEYEASRVEQFNVRRVSIRIGIVLDRKEGALKLMQLPFRFYAGGYLGSGEQWISWVHVKDVAEIFVNAIDNPSFRGAYNATAPNPVKMKDFAASLGKAMNRPAWFNVPSFALRIVTGEAADTILSSPKVIPQRLNQAGYRFCFSNIDEALKDIFSGRESR